MLENPLSWIECMHFMPDRVFNYYVLGFCQVTLSSKKSSWPDDEVVAASFLSLINDRYQNISRANRQIVVDACDFLARYSVSQTPDTAIEMGMLSTDSQELRRQIDGFYQDIFVKHQQTGHNQTSN